MTFGFDEGAQQNKNKKKWFQTETSAPYTLYTIEYDCEFDWESYINITVKHGTTSPSTIYIENRKYVIRRAVY